MNSRYRYAVAVTVVSLCCRLLDITRLRVDVMHLDDALKMLGEFGWYQRVHLLLVCGFAILCAWHGLNMVFLGAVPHFHCSLSDVNATWYGVNQSQLKDLLIPEGEGCKRYSVNSSLHRLTSVQWVNADVTNGTAAQEACPAGYVFSTDEYDSTITSEFKLVCTKKFLQSISKCVFFAGRFLGAAVFGQLSDRFGRRPMFFVGVAMMMLTGGVAAAAPNVFVFLSMYLLQGAASTGAFVISYILKPQTDPNTLHSHKEAGTVSNLTSHGAGWSQVQSLRRLCNPNLLQSWLRVSSWDRILHPQLEILGVGHNGSIASLLVLLVAPSRVPPLAAVARQDGGGAARAADGGQAQRQGAARGCGQESAGRPQPQSHAHLHRAGLCAHPADGLPLTQRVVQLARQLAGVLRSVSEHREPGRLTLPQLLLSGSRGNTCLRTVHSNCKPGGSPEAFNRHHGCERRCECCGGPYTHNLKHKIRHLCFIWDHLSGIC
ncbi:carcinine transporter-like isoform X4 [Pomacea canaliculata]|uniref:carcinine transporter-like isoform X4 n=1 Tax=Pomacea canaliculata TaxID=400727 RepID=UPI000D73C059|nr:carcinine transporter-like isoform X4 [Pomacea canaliculata]